MVPQLKCRSTECLSFGFLLLLLILLFLFLLFYFLQGKERIKTYGRCVSFKGENEKKLKKK